jgi:hypothetical protein
MKARRFDEVQVHSAKAIVSSIEKATLSANDNALSFRTWVGEVFGPLNARFAETWANLLLGKAVSDSYVTDIGRCRASGKACHVGTVLVPLRFNVGIEDGVE